MLHQGDETPPMSAPPVFTPPEAPPSFMLAPQQVIVTQATPMVEDPDDGKDGKAASRLTPTPPARCSLDVCRQASGLTGMSDSRSR